MPECVLGPVDGNDNGPLRGGAETTRRVDSRIRLSRCAVAAPRFPALQAAWPLLDLPLPHRVVRAGVALPGARPSRRPRSHRPVRARPGVVRGGASAEAV